MGTTAKHTKIPEEFYAISESILTNPKGKDLCVLGDFSAKVSRNERKLNCIGSQSTGTRKINGEHPCDFPMKKIT